MHGQRKIHYFFLSRLCGGELTAIANAVGDSFLSRLCGGEPFTIKSPCGNTFLSRLCGGEHSFRPAFLYGIFLSRLCGGELKRNALLRKRSGTSIDFQRKNPILSFVSEAVILALSKHASIFWLNHGNSCAIA